MTETGTPPERSPWNIALEAILERPELTKSAHRLYLALARSLLGFRKQEERLGEDLLRTRGKLDGRTFERARSELTEAGLLHFEPGSRGAGHRSLYRLLNPALERDLNPALERGLNPAENPAENPAQVSLETPRWSGDEVLKNEERTTALPASASQPGRLADVLAVWVRNEGHNYSDEAILDEIEQRERKSKHDEKVDEKERARLLELAAELRRLAA